MYFMLIKKTDILITYFWHIFVNTPQDEELECTFLTFFFFNSASFEGPIPSHANELWVNTFPLLWGKFQVTI